MTSSPDPSWRDVLGAIEHPELEQWARQHADPVAAWSACDRPDWMLRLLARGGAEPRTLAACLCDCARTVLHLVPDTEPRSRQAIEAVEAWSRGERTDDACRRAPGTALAAVSSLTGTARDAAAAIRDIVGTAAQLTHIPRYPSFHALHPVAAVAAGEPQGAAFDRAMGALADRVRAARWPPRSADPAAGRPALAVAWDLASERAPPAPMSTVTALAALSIAHELASRLPLLDERERAAVDAIAERVAAARDGERLLDEIRAILGGELASAPARNLLARFVGGLARGDERTLAAVLELQGPDAEEVAAADRVLSRWLRQGSLAHVAGRLTLTLHEPPDPLVHDILATLPLSELRCSWSGEPRLEVLPESWLHETLEELVLTEHRLRDLPPRLFALPRLRELRVDHNQIETLPEQIDEAPRLEFLDATANRLRSLPDTLCFGSLRVLRLGYNAIERLPDEIGALVPLRELELQHNAIERLPESIGRLRHLAHLDLAFNRLTALPDTLGHLGALRELGLRHNAIEHLPDSVTSLASLEALRLSDNRLAALPGDIGRLSRLSRLDLHRNRLIALPDSIASLPLYALLLPGNPLRSLPRAVFDMPDLGTIVLDQSELDPETRRHLAASRLCVYEDDPDED